MTHLNFSPRLIGVVLRQYQKVSGRSVRRSSAESFPPQALSYPVPQNFAVLRRLRTPSEAIASSLA